MTTDGYATGGVIDELVVGIGYRTRRPYSIHEGAVGTPLVPRGKHDISPVIETHIHVTGQIAPEDLAPAVRQALRLVDSERQ